MEVRRCLEAELNVVVGKDGELQKISINFQKSPEALEASRQTCSM
jgi:hypothetical protein